MATAIAPIKVDPETDRLIANAAHFPQQTKKEIVCSLDGSPQSAVTLLTGMSVNELDELGGFDK